MSWIRDFNSKVRSFGPIQQALIAVGCLLVIQYTGNIVAYYEVLPIVFGKDPNGIIKNSSYLVPGLLSIILTSYLCGMSGLKRLFSPYTIWRVHPGYWILVIVVMVGLNYVGLLLSDIVLMRAIEFRDFTWVGWDVVLDWTPFLVRIGISDELFWVGFVLTRLVKGGLPPLQASLLLGCFWGLDYIPYVFTGFFLAEGVNVSTQLLASAALAPWYAWLYYRTGSALVLLVFAMCVQYAQQFFPLLPHMNDGSNVETVSAIFVWFVASMLFWKLFPVSAKASEPVRSEQLNNELEARG